MKKLLTVLAIFAFILPAFAATYYVDPAYPPGGDGSVGWPFNTIGEALMYAISPGDVVTCAAGDYFECIDLQSGTPGHDGVTVMGIGAGNSNVMDEVSFNGTNNAMVTGFTINDSVTFDGDTSSVLSNCEVFGVNGVSLVNGSSGVVSNCDIYANIVGVTCDSSAGTIDGCNIYQNVGSGIVHTGSDASQSAGCNIFENGADGILAEGSSTPTSNGNIIEDNTANGIHVEGSADMTSDGDICQTNQSNGFYMEGSSQATITSLTSQSNTMNGLYIEGSAYAGTISNSTIQQNTLNGIWIDSGATASMTLNNNTVSQNDQSGIVFGTPMKSSRVRPATTAVSLAGASAPASLSNLGDGGYAPLALTIELDTLTVENNAGTGIVFNTNNTYKVWDCDIMGNDLGVAVGTGVNPDLGGGAQSSVGGNDISDNVTRDFVNNSASNVYAKLCNWTTSSETEMSGEHPDTVDVTLIDDYWENSSCGYVMWDDFGGGAVEETTWGQLKAM
ncbi:right-handed parallel beta-helix repeat-containing protein [bacterium]|nr:right-handed parallel beta-helix repeat-containing protein [bacterium]